MFFLGGWKLNHPSRHRKEGTSNDGPGREICWKWVELVQKDFIKVRHQRTEGEGGDIHLGRGK